MYCIVYSASMRVFQILALTLAILNAFPVFAAERANCANEIRVGTMLLPVVHMEIQGNSAELLFKHLKENQQLAPQGAIARKTYTVVDRFSAQEFKSKAITCGEYHLHSRKICGKEIAYICTSTLQLDGTFISY